MIDLITAKKLEVLDRQDRVYTKAVFEARYLNQLRTKKRNQPFSISVNIYGPQSDAGDIGKRLADVQGSLQHPFYLEDGVEYLNPQFFQLEEETAYMTHLVGLDESQIQAKALSDALENVLTSLDRSVGNPTISELDVIPDDLVTPLKESDKVPSLALGGILADVMGLGKTLTMITSVSATHLAAMNFQETNTGCNIDHLTNLRTSATLVVVTSTRKLFQ
ncbi:hypothetical protein NW766_010110 [Fusarium irregulare]|uniref:SNF2 N-terminal domain-containing protein n=1 Tax=Fusarium irregulare TaxID=2494466 RepID=A0A9W8U6Y6_9HYPO|nr:hypothetical protein NW766_010110 [Fusarium irregulare]